MNLPDIAIQPTALFNIQYGGIRSWLLITAVEFKIFNLTAENKTTQEIAAAINTHQANTELFLNALCALDLLRKEKGMYMNTELSDTFLVEGRQTYLGGYFLVDEQWNVQNKEQMKALIKNGPPVEQEKPDYSGDYFAEYVKDMGNLAKSGVSRLVAKEISSLPEFPGMRKMLELGGAHGIDCIATVMKNPDLTAVIFDVPSVIETTREIIAQYNLTERIRVMGGDYSTDSIGSGYDLIFGKATLNFYRDNLDPIFTKIYEALNPGGVFISIHDGLTDEGTKPADLVVTWLSAGLSAEDMSFAQEVIPNAMLKAGFNSVQTRPFPSYLGDVMDMNIARKQY